MVVIICPFHHLRSPPEAVSVPATVPSSQPGSAGP
jgi:hypothetical protein